MPIVTLLTDFGLDDYYVAAVRGTLLRLTPDLAVIPVDISHEVEAGDVEGGAYLLAAAAPTFPPGTVHLAVVDPGVGSPRRILVAAVGEALYVAPDNGLLTRVLAGGLVPPEPKPEPRVHAVERTDLFLTSPGQTFHGRDRFAPLAAALLRGEDLGDLGPEIRDPIRLDAPPPRREGRDLRGRIIHIDRFGNLITDIPSAWLPPDGGGFVASLGSRSTHRRVGFYAEIPAMEPAVLSGSLGTLELAANGESLAERWQIERGRELVVRLQSSPGAAQDPSTPGRAADSPASDTHRGKG